MEGTSRLKDEELVKETTALLFCLYAELGNRIYQLSVDEDCDEPIELLSASPPSNSVILTCRQAYTEAAGIYREARRCYCATHRFRLTLDFKTRFSKGNFVVESEFTDMIRSKAAKNHAVALKDAVRKQANEEWNHVRNIIVIQMHPDFLVNAELMPQCALWNRHASPLGNSLSRRDCTRLGRQSGRHGKVAAREYSSVEAAMSCSHTRRPASLKKQLVYLAGAPIPSYSSGH